MESAGEMGPVDPKPQTPAAHLRLRLLGVFVCACISLGILAGSRLWQATQNNHFSHLAHAWMQGRLDHGGTPPGYEHRRYDDWGRVTTIELRPHSALVGPIRGTRCVRTDCRDHDRKHRTQTYLTTSGEEIAIPRRDVQTRTDTWYVTFPPAPALAVLPAVAIWGVSAWDLLITVLLAAAIPVVLVWMLDRIRGTAEGRGREHLWIAAAWTLASPACWVATAGGVWFTAQIVGSFCTCMYLAHAYDARAPARAGLWLGLAVASRVTPAFAAVFFAWEWWRTGHRLHTLVRFAVPLFIIAAILMTLNTLRFDTPLEFGHRYLAIRWQTRIQEIGMFSPAYLGRNLEAMLWLAPQVNWQASPLVRFSQHGMGLLFATPWLLALLAARRTFAARRGLWLAVAAVAIPSLLYQNTGFRQFSYRFALDYLPMLLLLVALGGGARHKWFAALVVFAGVVQIYGAWLFTRAPGYLFVHDFWWPFAPLVGN